ncbi:FadR/GntR family transcriptional regulator [Tropicimonas sp. IMCC34011]|uniref:FadR/GntR family transcriptional regulator n=1 Tax=Tropicimonas sp. IMCC34011 TaxID=2248759 RepID=UPI001E413CF0|nr:FadR/GntR family transcriptional regulator [Tropicimonas sp. IMCC34011]
MTQIAESLRAQIEAGQYKAGDRLPSERELTEAHSVSRTVVREALALLRVDGLVEARKGSGVYAIGPGRATKPFEDIDTERLSSVIELFELRSAFEIRAAGLAAIRRSADQIDAIEQTHEAVARAIEDGVSPREADFAFHEAIALASNNRRFPEFLALIRPGIIPRVELRSGGGPPRPYTPNPDLVTEHSAIANAIIDGDRDAAEARMEAHLEGSLERYRNLWRGGGS